MGEKDNNTTNKVDKKVNCTLAKEPNMGFGKKICAGPSKKVYKFKVGEVVEVLESDYKAFSDTKGRQYIKQLKIVR